jgi:hypothetical protein
MSDNVFLQSDRIFLRLRFMNKQIHTLIRIALFIALFMNGFFAVDAFAQKAQKNIMPNVQEKIFKEIFPETSGIKFMNLVASPSELKKDSRLFTVASGGTSVGDVNGDGLIDIYLTSFIGKNSLFINKGNLRFEEAPESAGVKDSAGYGFGSTMVDIDGDGDLDIYVTKYNQEPNKLYINDGKGNFVDKAKEYGLAIVGNGIQSTFFDYDLDGDLDVLIVINGISVVGFKHEGVTPILMKNNGDETFTDVTQSAGITHKGYGLSATAADVNNDGWPDFYIANDFEEKDYLYINKKDGTFERKTRNELPHTVMFGMGNDIADFNNDNLMDIIAVDMLPETHLRRNTQFESFTTFSSTFDSSQFVQNTLQLNRGNGRFSDIAQISGIDATEWSWSVFFSDFDLDGNKDIFVANGLSWDIMDKDVRKLGVSFEKLQQEYDMMKYKQLSNSSKSKGDMREIAEDFDFVKLLRSTKRTRVPNYLFKNNGDLTFTKTTNEWGMDIPYNTCSASYADFDNDGDIDIIMNTIDSTAVLYENTMMKKGKYNYLKVQCVGKGKNTKGLGARIQVLSGGKTQIYELTSTRGFASGVASIAHFGLGNSSVVDELTVTWPGGKQQVLKKVKANTTLTLSESNATQSIPKKESVASLPLLKEITSIDTGAIQFLHKENMYDDFFNERLLPNQLSINGPALASQDIDGNGLYDVVIGGAQGYPLNIFYQMSEGSFSKATTQQIFLNDSLYEDQGILLFDAEKDGDIDIYVASGGNEMSVEKPELLQDRLYLNDGKGTFSKGVLPDMPVGKSCVIGNDIDNDGDLDLFVGGRNHPGAFYKEPRSYLLLNNNGYFSDVTGFIADPLMQPGRVKSALWSDFDNDGDKDLIVVGEWMKILLLQNNSGVFLDKTTEFGLDTTNGMWNSISGGDMDNDGDIDYVVGNVGTNSKYNEPTNQYPFQMFISDFDANGSQDYLQSHYEQGILYPSRFLGPVILHMPTLLKRYNEIEDIAQTDLLSIVGGDSILSTVKRLKASLHRSVILINNGNGKFTIKALPTISQASPIYGMQILDINADGNLDVIHAGNFYGPDKDTWRYDAGVGEVLIGDGKCGFKPISIQESGFYVPGQARSMISIPHSNGSSLDMIVGICKDQIQTFRLNLANKTKLFTFKDVYSTHLISQFKNGKTRKTEYYYGSGYYSQQPQCFILDSGMNSVKEFKNTTLIKEIHN